MGGTDQRYGDSLETVLLLAGKLAHTAGHTKGLNSAAQACQCSGDRHSGQEHLVGVDSAVLSGALAETDCPELITQSRLADDEPYEDGCCNSDDDTPVGCSTAGSCLDKFRREDAGRICHVLAGLTASDSPDGFQVYDVVGKVEGGGDDAR